MKDNNFNFNQVFLNILDNLSPSLLHTHRGTGSSATLAPYTQAKSWICMGYVPEGLGIPLKGSAQQVPEGYASEQLLSFLHLNNISANISEKSFSILLAKASFAFLLISMLSYWFQMSFKSQIMMNNKVIVSTNNKILNPLQVAEPHTNLRFVRVLAQRWRGLLTPYQSSYKSSICTEHAPGELRLEDLSENLSGNEICGLPLRGTAATCKKSVLAIILEKIPVISMWSANITLALLLSIRWIESGHFPLSNLYESLIFLSWSLTVIHLFLENLFYKNSLRESILSSPATVLTPLQIEDLSGVVPSNAPNGLCIPLQGSAQSLSKGYLNTNQRRGMRGRGTYVSDPTLTLGAITSPVVLFTNAFATFSLPQEMQKVTVLVPALKSNWLIMHVSVMIISYAALLSGSLLAMAFLVIKFIDELRRNKEVIVSTNNKILNPLQVAEPHTNLRFVRVLAQRWRDMLIPYHSSYKSKICTEHAPGGSRLGDLSEDLSDSYCADPLRGMQSPKGVSSSVLMKESKAEGLQPLLLTRTQRVSLTNQRALTPDKSKICMGSAPFNAAAPLRVQSKERALLGTTLEGVSITPSGVSTTPSGVSTVTGLPVTTENKVLMDLPQILDNLSYRSIGLGFALLTIGILSGAVWANEAWGSYWSWDPKETWAFITWLVFALYLHTRLSKGWVGKESAFVASFGFIVIWFCYLGVNLFGKGLHSYGWFQQ